MTRSENFKTKIFSLIGCLGSSFCEILIECFIQCRRPANPYFFQLVLMLTQAFFNECLIPSFLALITEPRVKLEVFNVFLLTQFFKSLAHIKGDSFFLFGKRYIQYESESFTKLFILGSIQLA